MTENTGLIYLQKDKFNFFQASIGKVIEFRFVPEIIRDLEVVNPELLDNLIKLFITNNKINPSELIIVLADNSCFIKDFISPPSQANPGESAGPDKNPQNLIRVNQKASDDEINSFIEHIPFENVASRTFDLANGKKVIAANRDLFEAIKSTFEKNSFKVNFVLPGVVFDNNIGTKNDLDIVTANSIIANSETVKEQNLLSQKNFVPEINQFKKEEEPMDIKKQQTKKSNKRLYIMTTVFIILIIILIFVYLGSIQTPSK